MPPPSANQQCIRADTTFQLFFYVGLEAQPVQQSRRYIQHYLEPDRLGQGKKAIISVKERNQPLDRLHEAVRTRLIPHHKREPATKYSINHHVKYDGG